ncbi:hypothetical protein L292_1399 [Acinetobacter junii CIP 107470 = MTCC 11364]|uniref:Uncharacterized protein n=1 Tax=Acinetobacter junii CIP 107470 = MTCC 11364 TaxID=1217666 RepID=S7XNS7_ACIJU|nr:hypothetical protein [Acinetobacter junii]ENV50407.1 hypothetical protein F953_02181 [Acinetobacter junii CIP 107470 = MTCC 11364]EPR80769.1 hypothetical protein L292_1399 [Acinetobacter junii CIP 107470 = MTCC 11364]
MADSNNMSEYGLYPIIEVKELYQYKLLYLQLIEELDSLPKENEALKLYILDLAKDVVTN